jgi:hypothetical protein
LRREIASAPGALADLLRPVLVSVTDVAAPQKKRCERKKGDPDKPPAEIAADEKYDSEDERQDGAVYGPKPHRLLQMLRLSRKGE